MLTLLLLATSALAYTTKYEKQYGHLDTAAKWNKFKKDFNKVYGHGEEMEKFENFVFNLGRIEEHNSDPANTYWFGITEFADMTAAQFKNHTSCFVPKRSELVEKLGEAKKKEGLLGMTQMASGIDWDAQGMVTPVKNQGQCGSCWAFSTTGAMESAYAIKHRQLPSLSEQELVDCAPRPNSGCNGGSMYYAFQFAEQGLCSESAYPYKGQTLTSECRSMESGCSKQVYSTGGHMVTARSMTALMQQLNSGPVSIAIEADQRSFQLYTEGVFSGTCGTNLDHGVLVVGYGTDSRYGDFWKVKNSWGSSWGENGYIRLCRNCNKNRSSGQCGILEQPVYPTVQ